jgi:hypothetical protein
MLRFIIQPLFIFYYINLDICHQVLDLYQSKQTSPLLAGNQNDSNKKPKKVKFN